MRKFCELPDGVMQRRGRACDPRVQRLRLRPAIKGEKRRPAKPAPLDRRTTRAIGAGGTLGLTGECQLFKATKFAKLNHLFG
jgi:hypothetical protein